MTNKVLVIFTGGTIAMKIDPDLHAAIPALNADEIISTVTNIKNYAEIEVLNFCNLPSPHITPRLMMKLANVVKKNITRDDITGIIITHGTDTLEETAFLLDIVVKTEKPIIVIGAMRNHSELGYDGSSNLSAAICTAISSKARNKGVLVVMNNEVNAASQVTKTNTLSLDTFKSPEFGPLGIVDNDEVIFYREKTISQFIDTDTLEEKVALIKCGPGMESDILEFYINAGYRGIVIEALGRGNVPPAMMPGVIKAIQNKIPVVMVSRCFTGRVLDTYGYEGGGRNLRDVGVLFGGFLPGQKARIKLMVILGKTQDLNEIKELFEYNVR